MSLIPRWRYMTDAAKALTKRTVVSALVVLLVMLVFRALVPGVVTDGAADPPHLKTTQGKGNQTQLDIPPVQVVHLISSD